jgi:hypothetical protein
VCKTGFKVSGLIFEMAPPSQAFSESLLNFPRVLPEFYEKNASANLSKPIFF